MRHIWLYITELWQGWIGAMSSTASVIFLILGLYGTLTSGFQRRYWLIASLACYVIASYRVWSRIRPDLLVDIQGVSTQPLSFAWSDLDQLHSLVLLKLLLVNTAFADNAITQYRLIMKNGDDEVVGRRFTLHGYGVRGTYTDPTDLATLIYKVVKQGEPVEGYACFAFQNADPRNQTAMLFITDSYKATRKFRIRVPSETEEEIYRKLPNDAFRDLL